MLFHFNLITETTVNMHKEACLPKLRVHISCKNKTGFIPVSRTAQELVIKGICEIARDKTRFNAMEESSLDLSVFLSFFSFSYSRTY